METWGGEEAVDGPAPFTGDDGDGHKEGTWHLELDAPVWEGGGSPGVARSSPHGPYGSTQICLSSSIKGLRHRGAPSPPPPSLQSPLAEERRWQWNSWRGEKELCKGGGQEEERPSFRRDPSFLFPAWHWKG